MATTILQPVVIPQAFSQGGQRADLPNSATGSNRASFQEGFPTITSTPVADGGIPPNRLDFNGAFYTAMSHGVFGQSGGKYTFNVDVSNAIGGYPAGAVLWYAAGGYFVQSLKNNNTDNFVTTPSFINNSTSWAKISINARGDAMVGTLPDQTAAQIRNIQVVSEEPTTGENGTIYAIIE